MKDAFEHFLNTDPMKIFKNNAILVTEHKLIDNN